MNDFSLTLTCDDENVVIRVLNNNQVIIGEASGSLNIRIPKGLYRIQVCLLGVVYEESLKLTSDTEKKLSPPGRFSSALLSGYGSSHEYYSYPARDMSRTVSGTFGSPLVASGLFVFIRFASNQHKDQLLKDRQNLFAGFELYDENLNRLPFFSDNDIVQDLNWGYAGVSLRLERGTYFIKYTNKKSFRLIPLQLFAGWQTQVFLIMHKEPLFESLRILMAHLYEGFDPNSPLAHQMDQALLKLENRNLLLNKSILDTLAYGKWENPLLGILWCYIYIIEDRHDQEDLFNTITRNLEDRILFDTNLPDLKTIRILRDKVRRNEYAFANNDMPPLFRIGFEELVRKSYDDLSTIKSESLMAFLSPKLVSGTIWTIYEFSFSAVVGGSFKYNDNAGLTIQILKKLSNSLNEQPDHFRQKLLSWSIEKLHYGNMKISADFPVHFSFPEFSLESVWVAQNIRDIMREATSKI